MCMHVSLHVCLMSEEGEKGVDSHGTWVLGDCGKQRQEDLREFEASQDYLVRHNGGRCVC